jgi:hypothetical protein
MTKLALKFIPQSGIRKAGGVSPELETYLNLVDRILCGCVPRFVYIRENLLTAKGLTHPRERMKWGELDLFLFI